MLTSEISKIYDDDLPFLFKVLSVRIALSIQAHPDKKLGKELFEKFPKIYKGEVFQYFYFCSLFILVIKLHCLNFRSKS